MMDQLASVSVPANQTSATFSITGVADGSATVTAGPLNRSFLAALLLAAGSLAIPASVPAAGPPAQPQDSVVTMGENSAEITLPRPTRYVVLLHEAGKVRTLHTRGDVLFHPQDPGRSITIERIDGETILLRESHKTQARTVRVGKPIPGFPGLRFTETVMLEKIQYQSRPIDHLAHPEPVVVALERSHAIVVVEVLRTVSSPPSASLAGAAPGSGGPQATPMQRRKLDPTLFEELPVKEVEPNTYEVDATAVGPAIENVGQVLADLQPMVAPALSMQSGLTFNLTSSVVDGTLSNAGFTVTNSKIAQRFGIEVGDIIKQFNGHEVNSPLNAWMTYQEFIIRNPLQSEMRVDFQRNGTPMTKMYRVR
ncbi:MAG: hypothetical protein AUH74_07220 [Nitrospirae bacterium 13_1_40CM_4_62_6]|nr:MAG: hypothetical protein AUH74_07220 [Nitrospirae bacterium 13_1_40CM_4_62_6]